MTEDGIALRADPHRCEVVRQITEVPDLDAGDVFEVAGVVGVAADAVGFWPRLICNSMSTGARSGPSTWAWIMQPSASMSGMNFSSLCKVVASWRSRASGSPDDKLRETTKPATSFYIAS
jgi:hypothetical protein